MNYYTIYEKLLISLYFPLPSFFLFICCKNNQYFSFMQVFGGFLLCFQRKNVNLQKNVERFNVKVMAATVLNSTQVHLLQMFQVDDSQKGLEELKELLYSYYSKKMDESLNELWDSGVLDQKRLDEINNMDLPK